MTSTCSTCGGGIELAGNGTAWVHTDRADWVRNWHQPRPVEPPC